MNWREGNTEVAFMRRNQATPMQTNSLTACTFTCHGGDGAASMFSKVSKTVGERNAGEAYRLFAIKYVPWNIDL